MQKIKMYQDGFLSKMRLKSDDIADNTIHDIFLNQDKELFNKIFSEIQINSKSLPEGLPESVIQYFDVTSKLPEWADLKKMNDGAAFFSRNSPQILLLLGFYSLPYCYAAANGAQVLHITKRITDEPGKRFIETSEFVMDVMAPNAFEKRGRGIRSIQKVRLIHAIVRHYTKKNVAWNSDWGIPVNQEDMAGTNLAFSLIVIRGLRKMGINVSPSEASSYMHLWNVIGFILGVDEILLPDNKKEAYLLDKLIAKRQFNTSIAGKDLTASLINFIKSTSPATLPVGFVESYMRFLLGDSVSDLLEIPFVRGSFTLITSIQNLNKISSLLNINNGNYFKTFHMVKMQRSTMSNENNDH